MLGLFQLSDGHGRFLARLLQLQMIKAVNEDFENFFVGCTIIIHAKLTS